MYRQSIVQRAKPAASRLAAGLTSVQPICILIVDDAPSIELDKLVETLLVWIRPREAGSDGSSGAVSHAAFEPTVPSLPGLDLERAAGQLGGDQRLLRSVLESFRRDFSDAPVRVQELIELGQLPDAARMVHTIKGLAPNLGAPALAVAAAEYEAALRQGDAQAELHGRFIQTLTEVLATLDGLESEPTREPVASSTAATPEDLETLRALAANLDQSVIISQLQKDRVASVLHGRIDAVQIDKLFTAISHLDYSEAARVLGGILRELRGTKTA